MIGFVCQACCGLALIAAGWPDAGGVVLTAALVWLMDEDDDEDDDDEDL